MSFDAAPHAARRFVMSLSPRVCARDESPLDSNGINDSSLNDTLVNRRVTNDQGISMVEIVISMFLLTVLSLALVPLLITVTQHTVVNRNTLAATSFAQSELTRVQAAFPSNPANTTSSCAGLRSRATAAGSADPTGTFKAFLTVSVCPVSYPGIVPIKITVKKDGRTVSTLSSHVRVAKAS